MSDIFSPPQVEPTDARDVATDLRVEQARKLIRRNVYWALGLGAVPIPFVDAAGVLVVQIKMLRELARLYDVAYSDNRAKAIVTSLISSLGAQALSYAFVGSIFKLIPALGPAFALVTMPVVSGALTQTLGNVFVMHFEAGGTLLDFDVPAMRSHFKQEFERNKIVVEELRRSPSP